MSPHLYRAAPSGLCSVCGLTERAHDDDFVPPPLTDPGPVARTGDPWTSRAAAESIEPARESARGRVLALLRDRSPGWVRTDELVGEGFGVNGSRRLRELRALGYEIEVRPVEGSKLWEYRLLPDDDPVVELRNALRGN